MKKKTPTQADLDAANAEVRDLMGQVQALKVERDERQRVDQLEKDRQALIGFCRIMDNCHIPPNIAAASVWAAPDRSKVENFIFYIGDLQMVAGAIKRMLDADS